MASLSNQSRRRYMGSSQATAKAVLLVAAFAMIGYLGVRASSAATYAAHNEAEAGVQTGNIDDGDSVGASNNASVKFGAVVTPPSGGSDPCATIPSLPSAKPDASTTGVPAGTTLTNSGTITVTTDGTVIDGKSVTGIIEVKANNVTIKNTKVNAPNGTLYGIRIYDTTTGTKVLHSEVSTAGGGYTGINLEKNAGTFCANNVHGWENGITSTGSNVTIQANYVHGLQAAEAGAHHDCIEIYGGSSLKVVGNNLLVNDPSGNWLPETGALNATTDFGVINGLEVYGNWFGGGSYSLYIRDSGANYSNVSVHDNRWIRNSQNFGPVSTDGGITWTNNVWDDNGQQISN